MNCLVTIIVAMEDSLHVEIGMNVWPCRDIVTELRIVGKYDNFQNNFEQLFERPKVSNELKYI